MLRRSALWLVVALLAVAVAAPGRAAAASGLTLTPPAVPAAEGSPVEVTAAFDPAGGAPSAFRFVWGDGASTLVAAPAAPPYTVTADHVYADEGTYAVRVGVTIPGQEGISRGATISVGNAAPVLDPLPDSPAPLGQPFELVVGFVDPGSGDVHQVTVAWGDGSSDVLGGVGGGSAAFAHTYATAAAFPVTVGVDDGEGGVATGGFVATVVPYCAGRPVTLDAALLPAGQPVLGTAGDDVILGTAGADVIDARGGNDAVCAGGGDDTVDGSGGDDTLLGEGGHDTVRGGAGNDSLLGGIGNDLLDGWWGHDLVRGEAGDDTLRGDSGNDMLQGGAGNDSLDAGVGDDTLDGGLGHDQLLGGAGDDTGRAGRGNDTASGDLGNDTLFGDPGDDTLLGGAGADTLLGGAGADALDGGTEADTLDGGAGPDTLLGGDGGDLLRGAGDADDLQGGTGADALGGGPGPDLLGGGDGDDVLHGGTGRDHLTGGAGTDFLFRSEYPSLDTMDGGPDTGEPDVVETGKRGTYTSGIRRYLTEDEALAFQGSYLLGEFTTYHNCCENRVVNIQLMADTVHGHVVLPGEVFSINATVGQRTLEKGYLLAGAIIGAYVQCCDDPANVGGGTSQFGTTFYNALFFAGMEDVEHQPHSLDFARYPDGREATMGWPHPDVAFRNNSGHPVLITTHHSGYYGTSITVRMWGDNGGIGVEAGASPRRNYYNTSRIYYEGDRSLSPGQEVVKYAASPGFTIDVFRYITYPDGRTTTEKWTWTYQPQPKVAKVHPCEVPPGNPDYTGEACPGGNDPDPPKPPPDLE